MAQNNSSYDSYNDKREIIKPEFIGLLILLAIPIVLILVSVLEKPIIILISVGLIAAIVLVIAIFKNPTVGIFFILLVAPLDKFRLFISQPISFNLKLIHIFLFITLIAWLFKILVSGKPYFIIDRKLTILITILFLAFGLSVLMALDSRDSMEVLLQRLLLLSILIAIVNHIKAFKDLQRGSQFLIAGALFSVGYGIFQMIGFYSGFNTDIPFLANLPQVESYRLGLKVSAGVPRMNSFINDPNVYGAYLLAILGLTISLFLTHYQRERRISTKYLLILLPLTIALIATVSRSAILGFGVMLLILWFYFRKQLFKPRLFLIGILAILSFVALINFTQVGQSFLGRMFGEGGASQASTNAHLNYAKTAMDMIKARPITGVGLGGYIEYVTRFINPNATTGMTHSMYLTLLAETGPLSFLAVILIIFYLWVMLGKLIKHTIAQPEMRAQLIGWRAFLLGFAVSSIFYSYLSYEFIWVFLGLIVASILIAKKTVFQEQYQYEESH